MDAHITLLACGSGGLPEPLLSNTTLSAPWAGTSVATFKLLPAITTQLPPLDSPEITSIEVKLNQIKPPRPWQGFIPPVNLSGACLIVFFSAKASQVLNNQISKTHCSDLPFQELLGKKPMNC